MTKLKEKLGQGWVAFKGFLVKRWPWVVAALVLALLLFTLVYAGYWVPWTGFGGYTNSKGEWLREKTLWDWLDLLLVPLLLALGAWFLNRAAREREHKTELDRSRDAALQTYMDRVSTLLRSQWRESGEGFLEANIIRAQTLTVVRQLDGQRNYLLFQFLRESGLIVKDSVVTLREANLGGVDLSMTDLSRADLQRCSLFEANLYHTDLLEANLRGAVLSRAQLFVARLHRADLRDALLRETDLHSAVLSGADMRGADLRMANLRGADMRGADMGEADLRGADLRGADLRGVTPIWHALPEADLRAAQMLGEANLSMADLRWAKLEGAHVTNEQLAQAKSLEGATLPDGTVHE